MKKWKVLSTNTKITSEDDVARELFKLRKIDKKTSEKFLNPKISDLKIEECGILLPELEKGIKRIKKAIKKDERIIILGDYDVDGICASAILWETLYKKHSKSLPYIPDRFSEGYGISVKTVDNLLEKYPDVKLIITVDNGIVANESIAYAGKKGIDVIITDHHAKGETLPNAHAIIHTTALCGAGVAWMLARSLGIENEDAINEKLELAALATVADLVPLTGFNRVIVKTGINYLRNTKRVGLIELFKIAKIEKEKIDTYHIGFIIGPRLNASGRISHAKESLRLVCSADKNYVKKTAFLLDQTNRLRQQMVKESALHAKLSVLKEKTLGKLIIVFDKSYSEGVVGLIASKLVEEYYRPTLAISIGEKISKGSARSIKGVNIIDLIRKYEKHLIGAGGHPMAAGFTIETEKIELFKSEIVKGVEKEIADELLNSEVRIDMEVPIGVVTMNLFNKIEDFAPFGMENPKPTFMIRGAKIINLGRVGNDSSHLKIDIEKDGKSLPAIGFGLGDREINIGDTIDIAFAIDVNEWRDRKTLQLKIKDLTAKN